MLKLPKRATTSDPVWSDKMRGRRVLVTGGCGFVGSHIADLLVGLGCQEIILVDNMVRGSRANIADILSRGNIRVVEGDIRDANVMESVMPGISIVFHQAALRITHCAAEPRAGFEVMASATFDLLEKCVAHGVSKIVMASSASVYGMAEQFPTSESHHAYANRTLYGAYKVFAESMLRSFKEMYGLEYLALRYFNVYGPRMDLHGKYTEVLIRWMQRIAAGLPPVIFGDGQQSMDMIHVRDIARANIQAAISPATDHAINVGSGRETSLLELATMLANVMERSDLIPVHEAERTVNPVPRRLADGSLARRVLNFNSSISLQDGLEELVGWWRENEGFSAREAAE